MKHGQDNEAAETATLEKRDDSRQRKTRSAAATQERASAPKSPETGAHEQQGANAYLHRVRLDTGALMGVF